MKQLKFILKKHLWTIIGVLIGLIAGNIYYWQVGCEEGCTITGDPINSTLYGGLMGGLLLSMVNDFLKKEKK